MNGCIFVCAGHPAEQLLAVGLRLISNISACACVCMHGDMVICVSCVCMFLCMHECMHVRTQADTNGYLVVCTA